MNLQPGDSVFVKTKRAYLRPCDIRGEELEEWMMALQNGSLPSFSYCDFSWVLWPYFDIGPDCDEEFPRVGSHIPLMETMIIDFPGAGPLP